MKNISKLLILTIGLWVFSGCANKINQTNEAGISLVVDPFVFHIDSSEAQTIEVFSFTTSLAGANISVGNSHDEGFGMSKALPNSLFANGPTKLKVSNRKFLELLLDKSEESEDIVKYRQAMGISEAIDITEHTKGDWLFISYLTDLGAVAYGATVDYELVFQINHNEGLAALNELIEGATPVR